MKQQDDLKTQTQTEVLDQAMLGLFRLGLPMQADEEPQQDQSDQSKRQQQTK